MLCNLLVTGIQLSSRSPVDAFLWRCRIVGSLSGGTRCICATWHLPILAADRPRRTAFRLQTSASWHFPRAIRPAPASPDDRPSPTARAVGDSKSHRFKQHHPPDALHHHESAFATNPRRSTEILHRLVIGPAKRARTTELLVFRTSSATAEEAASCVHHQRRCTSTPHSVCSFSRPFSGFFTKRQALDYRAKNMTGPSQDSQYYLVCGTRTSYLEMSPRRRRITCSGPFNVSHEPVHRPEQRSWTQRPATPFKHHIKMASCVSSEFPQPTSLGCPNEPRSGACRALTGREPALPILSPPRFPRHVARSCTCAPTNAAPVRHAGCTPHAMLHIAVAGASLPSTIGFPLGKPYLKYNSEPVDVRKLLCWPTA